jgi:hypothetical protein
MNRNELAKELGVWPWNVDDWLLWGCPAIKLGKGWKFDIEKVRMWFQAERIKIKGMKRIHSTMPAFDQRWFRERCPICIDKGFSGGKAGRVYTLGEVSDGEWHLRRTGVPCGHSADVPIEMQDPNSPKY